MSSSVSEEMASRIFLRASGLVFLHPASLLGTVRLSWWVPEIAVENKFIAGNERINGSITKSGEGSTRHRLSEEKAKGGTMFQVYLEMVWVMGKSSSL